MSLERGQLGAAGDPRTLRAARQLVRTNTLLGVDFVPVRGGWGAGAAPAAAAAEAESAPEPAAERPRPEAARPVVRGATPVAPPAAPRASFSAPVAAGPVTRPGSPPRRDPGGEPEPAAAAAMVEVKPRVLDARQQEQQKKLDAVRARYEKDAPHSKFVTDHHCVVFGDGDPCARLMIIGEAPGAEEDKVGLPFVGRAGQLLEKMLGGMGIRRSDVYITNVLKTRPPDNATPTADEAAACAPYLFEQIKIIGPEAILALGLPATRVLLNTTESMSRLRGKWWTYTDPRTIGYEVPVMPTYHPAFLLRSYTRENREKVWSDLQMVMQRLGLAGRGGGVGG